MKTLYILSDSTGVGQYATVHKTWPVLLAQHLEGRYVVQNVSRNGETSRQALERLVPDVLRYEPDVVYVQYGSNDANMWETDRGCPRVFPDEFKANMLSIVRRCKAFGAYLIVGDNHTHAYNNEIMSVQSCCDAWVENRYVDGVQSDGIHLSERGHQLYFENIKKEIPC